MTRYTLFRELRLLDRRAALGCSRKERDAVIRRIIRAHHAAVVAVRTDSSASTEHAIHAAIRDERQGEHRR